MVLLLFKKVYNNFNSMIDILFDFRKMETILIDIVNILLNHIVNNISLRFIIFPRYQKKKRNNKQIAANFLCKLTL